MLIVLGFVVVVVVVVVVVEGDIYGLLTKREVKMAGYWPSPFFEKRKKNEANIQPS